MRKLKSSVVLILILLGLLSFTILGIIITKPNKPVIDPEPEDVVVIPDTFAGNIDNNVGVPEDLVKAITDYIDDYYLSVFKLEEVDMDKHFSDDICAAISKYANKLIIESRKLYDYDFTLSKAHYDLKFTDYTKVNGKHIVSFLEDDYMNFSFIKDITSESLEIENVITLDDEYKICDYDKTQGYYIMFYENKLNSVKEYEDLYNFYYKQIKSAVENENYLRQQASEKPYMASKPYDVAYDRNKAVMYADKYYHNRNSEWYDFTDEGGNCQNYASQCIYAGGGIMDYTGEYQWKCYIQDPDYDPAINEDDEKYGRSASWVHVSTFKEYCEENEGRGIVTDSKANLFYSEPGDIIQVGITSVSHTTIVSKVIDGHILLNSNSIDMKDWPLDAYTYPTKKLIKVLGSNE